MTHVAPAATSEHDVRFPEHDGTCPTQDTEFCEVRMDGRWRRLRFHDYAEIYSVPGLYERLFYEQLRCDSPRVVCGLLGEHLEARGLDPAELSVFDVGAGNGMVGEQLRELGAATVVGADIIPEAAMAAERDRPDVYDDYLVADLTDLTDEERERLAGHEFNCLTTVAALGFGDIPPLAFSNALDLVAPGGHVAFTIKEEFLRQGDGSGFSDLIESLAAEGALEIVAERRYQHRLSIAGNPLYYVAMIAEKRA